jgi:uncharacterized membrane protein
MKELKTMVIFLIVFAIFGFICVAINNSQDHFDTADYTTKWHTVEKGETLWELGIYYKAESDDAREWISAVKKLNEMSNSSLTAGDDIKIYVAK